ncbi:hypothetical protein FPQ18DRAFT_307522 [Pyronema domesticum]|nr:hypothetical protein FPQ18DRAFT_307522 [Pyronema domesticum]
MENTNTAKLVVPLNRSIVRAAVILILIILGCGIYILLLFSKFSRENRPTWEYVTVSIPIAVIILLCGWVAWMQGIYLADYEETLPRTETESEWPPVPICPLDISYPVRIDRASAEEPVSRWSDSTMTNRMTELNIPVVNKSQPNPNTFGLARAMSTHIDSPQIPSAVCNMAQNRTEPPYVTHPVPAPMPTCRSNSYMGLLQSTCQKDLNFGCEGL